MVLFVRFLPLCTVHDFMSGTWVCNTGTLHVGDIVAASTSRRLDSSDTVKSYLACSIFFWPLTSSKHANWPKWCCLSGFCRFAQYTILCLALGSAILVLYMSGISL